MRLNRLTPDAQVKIVRIHHEVFGGDVACKQCPGKCCSNCAPTRGYHDLDEPQEVTEARMKKYGFDKKRGFKGANGCKLPVTERSSTCLAYACGGVGGSWGFGPPKGVNKPFTSEHYQRLNKMLDQFYEKENVVVRYIKE